MFERRGTRRASVACALLAAAVLSGLATRQGHAQQAVANGPAEHARLQWQTRASERRAPLWMKAHGVLTIDGRGVGFRTKNGRAQHWGFEEIHTAYLGPHRVVIETYQNRSLHRPGVQHFRFHLSRALPPAVAAELAANIGRPVQNDDPDASAPAMATIPVRHRGLMHGTNGVLRVRKGGIDYVTASKGDSRSWRWADIQTLSEPDPYHLYLFGYRDTYTFDLKAPLSRALFRFATDEIYGAAEAGGQR